MGYGLILTKELQPLSYACLRLLASAVSGPCDDDCLWGAREAPLHDHSSLGLEIQAVVVHDRRGSSNCIHTGTVHHRIHAPWTVSSVLDFVVF